MPRIMVKLTETERRALVEQAARERRHPCDQAAVILSSALKADRPAEPDDRPEPAGRPEVRQ